MDKRILLLIAIFCVGSLAFFVWRKQFYAHSGIHYEIRPGNMMIHVGDSITYRDYTENASRWKWSFGDGEYSVEQAGTHTYLQPGHYPIQLSVYGPFGILYDKRSVLDVLPAEHETPAHPEISGAATAIVNEAITFESNTTAESYEWTVFGEPGISGRDENGKSVVFAFKKPGIKNIQLTLHNPDLVLTREVVVNPAITTQTQPAAAPAPHKKPAARPHKPTNRQPDVDPLDLDADGVVIPRKDNSNN